MEQQHQKPKLPCQSFEHADFQVEMEDQTYKAREYAIRLHHLITDFMEMVVIPTMHRTADSNVAYIGHGLFLMRWGPIDLALSKAAATLRSHNKIDEFLTAARRMRDDILQEAPLNGYTAALAQLYGEFLTLYPATCAVY